MVEKEVVEKNKATNKHKKRRGKTIGLEIIK